MFFNNHTFSFLKKNRTGEKSFTLIEMIISIAVVVIVVVGVYQAYAAAIRFTTNNRTRTIATDFILERSEFIRNVPFASVGIVGGIPSGIIPRVMTVTRSGIVLVATTTIRNIDDPFDGTFTGTPQDTSPADYKLVEMSVGCPSCLSFSPLKITTVVAPKSLETTSGNGALFVKVIDANGLPVPQASVSIQSTATSAISFTDETNNMGVFQVVDVPPAPFAYRISATKGGYSSSTSATSSGLLPFPVIPDATIASGTLTQLTLAIDKVSSMTVKTQTNTCAGVPNVPVTITGSKYIGTTPNTYKYNKTHITDASGVVSLPGLEWDSYSIALGSPYAVAGTIATLPVSLLPDSHTSVGVVAKTLSAKALLVTVRDSSSLLPVSNATVTIQNGADTYTNITNRGFIRQTNWDGGAGQVNAGDSSMYFTNDGNVETFFPVGGLVLKKVFGDYVSEGNLVSSWFDVGLSSTTLYAISWAPLGQSASTSVRFQIESADNIASSTTGFIGPDGTNGTYYTLSDMDVSPINAHMRYHRYKAYLSTGSPAMTPILSDVFLSFASECTPHGQVYFDGLSTGNYSVSVNASGYTPASIFVPVTMDWQSTTVNLDAS
jgi:type II secretory pathway pseudopilin PulG